MDMILADSELKGLRPDPAWDVAGVRDMSAASSPSPSYCASA